GCLEDETQASCLLAIHVEFFGIVGLSTRLRLGLRAKAKYGPELFVAGHRKKTAIYDSHARIFVLQVRVSDRRAIAQDAIVHQFTVGKIATRPPAWRQAPCSADEARESESGGRGGL